MSKPQYTDMDHVDYPHLPGRLHDCFACEAGPCVCDPETDAPCVSEDCIQGYLYDDPNDSSN